MDHMDFLPTLIAAAGGPSDLKQQLLTGYQGYRVHLDGYNQLDMLLGSADSKRKEVIYYEGPTLQAIRYGDWKAHFIVQNEGWFGAKEKLGAPLLFNLRRDPYERAAEESGNYIEFLGKNMWAFGPAKRIIQGHLATFKDFPPRSESSQGNAEEIEERAGEVEVGQ
jgi:arylsulfatase